jgi:hypothetical protein
MEFFPNAALYLRRMEDHITSNVLDFDWACGLAGLFNSVDTEIGYHYLKHPHQVLLIRYRYRYWYFKDFWT